MDELFSKEKLQVAIPVLFGAIYFSAFKNGKQTCDRYFLNYFLYLLMSFAIYYYTMNEVDFDIKGLSIIVFIGLLGVVFAFSVVENVYLKHLLWIVLIVCLGIISRRFYEKFDKEDIKDAMKKLIIILIICVLATIGLHSQSNILPPGIPSNDLYGYWPLDGNVSDISGNNYDGTTDGSYSTDAFENIE